MANPQDSDDLKASLADCEAREVDCQRAAFEANAWLTAVVGNSDDAILSKTLGGTIMTWNAGAESLFGYTAKEAIGQSIAIIIPDDRLQEEAEIIDRLRAGERVHHFETVRRHKDGSLLDISLTVSPVMDAKGEIFGASKIARDLSPRKQALERQELLLREMNHRIKNLFALVTALVSLSARAAADVNELAEDLSARIRALSVAHALVLPDFAGDTIEHTKTTLRSVLDSILAPHDGRDGSRITIEGPDTPIGPHALSTVALLLHELATNAVKYGALAPPEGVLVITIRIDGDVMRMTWREAGAPARPHEHVTSDGFGSRLEKASLASLHATIERTWLDRGLEVSLNFPLKQLNR